ncbi:hypothetical protein MKW94_030607 [Papaver nudicaule]|uniref:Uncharacterized protein n=1 Tax=Papaver nudicaule TaxID=74823 RepID=A0AA41RVK9_PAPNU|nr:hypothetical protein [Papaver nudicaule]
MFKQSPSRNQRSKGGLRVKHALQVGVLLAVCIWLLYQVKHSHDKKRAFDESNAHVSEKMESDHELIRLGRKDLIPRVEEAVILNGQQNEEEGTEEEEEETKHEDVEEETKHEDVEDEETKHEDVEEEEETKHEDVEEEEETKHEDVEEDGEGNKHGEVEEEVKGDSDDEAEEHDREVSERGTMRDEDEDEESKERAEREEREKEDQIADVDQSRNTEEAQEQKTTNEDQIDHQDHDMNTQEAREEQYKGDDASSAVIREPQLLNSETDSGVSEKSNEGEHVEKTDSGELVMQNQSNSTEIVSADQKDNNLKAENLGIMEDNRTLNVTNVEEKNSGITLSKSVEDPKSNSTTIVEFVGQQEVNSSMPKYGPNSSSLMQNETDVTRDQTVVTIPTSTGDSNLQTTVSDQNKNSGTASDKVEVVSNSDAKVESVSNSTLLITDENANANSDDKVESVSNSTLLTTTENVNATNVESGDGQTMKSEIPREDAGNSVTSVTNEKNINGDQRDEPETTTGAEEKNINGVQKDEPGSTTGTEGTSNSVNSVTDEKGINGDHKDEPETTTGTEGTEENSSTYGDSYSVETKSADSNDTLIPEVREAVTDLGTLPEFATEGTNSEDASEK